LNKMPDILDSKLDSTLDSTLREMAQAIQQGEVTSVALVQGFLDRIASVNPALNAVVLMNTEIALKQAAKADSDLKEGTIHGPLHGIPMTIKDSLDTKDMVTTWGTKGREAFRPGRDATCVARLRDAGAILLGKTNTPEFTLSFQTNNLVYGRTNNPFNLALTPGGSSGGAAALIAANAIPFDIGTDTGGSIRLPAHFCGITGLKPTTGRVPCTGNALPSSGLLAPLSQPGPLARYVDDLEVILEIIQGPDLLDPYVADAASRKSSEVDPKSLRIGFHTDNGIATPMQAIQNAIANVVTLLQDDGYQVDEATPPGIEMASLIYSSLFGADEGDTVQMLLDDSRTSEYSPPVADMISGRQRQPAPNAVQVINLWDNYRSSMLSYFEQHDILICPVNAHTAIPHGEIENMADYSYTCAFNLTGWPSLVLRCGTDDTGMPIGLQILARPFREDHCLAIGKRLESLMAVGMEPFSQPSIYC
jgi:amidase